MFKFRKIKRIIRQLRYGKEGSKLMEAVDNGLRLGNDVCFIDTPNFGSEPYLISIGDKTCISFGVTFVNHDAGTVVAARLQSGNPPWGIFGPIVIGRNCFVGCRSIILPNVHVGDNVIIGAGSLVNKDIPSNSVAAGVPCRVLCSIAEYSAKHKDDFLLINKLHSDEKKEYLLKHFANEFK